ncbi:DEAD-domain-containing protein [Cylindrobasidium torrendii FP15055 ss-10]|uniref:ATP-dependent RNA helicase n=1 Tax=Cylindrobasidium torrendii FP15055 ss-10 TaxID=1314674 RepID=A0A0D7BL67_9AGAR|nr:DEAD-domain-containing protein [Cylindrobasidium torrendii FP15055 ss-10]
MATHFSERRFTDLPISQVSKNAIQHEFMTEVQAHTLEAALTGDNLLVQARTGTGKTLAFLLPAIERISKLKNRRGVSILVLAPTRELAQQIEVEAQALSRQHGLKLALAYGGVGRGPQVKAIQGGCDILVATPGRLVDLLHNFDTERHFANLGVYILDEVDRLLDDGFKRDLEQIAAKLPDPRTTRRQNLFFSATVDQAIKQVVYAQLKGDYKFISTVTEDEDLTHDHVDQSLITTPFAQHFATLIKLYQEDVVKCGGSSKIIAFFTTAALVKFAGAALGAMNLPVIELHSRLSQNARNKNTDTFRAAKTGILLSSDVAARGIDIPGITLVIQLGAPMSGEQYIHRLGRTARAGADGQGILILDPSETSFLRDKALSNVTINTVAAPSSDVVAPIQTSLNNALATLNDEIKGSTYQSWLGYYKSMGKITKWKAEELVRRANDYAVSSLGWKGPVAPEITPRAAGFMGLRGVAGINIGKAPQRQGGGGGGRGGRAQGYPTEGNSARPQSNGNPILQTGGERSDRGTGGGQRGGGRGSSRGGRGGRGGRGRGGRGGSQQP